MNKALFLLPGALALLGLAAISAAAQAGPILTIDGHTGTASAGTTSGHYIYTTFGSPRTGIHRGWRLVRDPATGTSGTAPLNGSTGLLTSVGTVYAPEYSAAGVSSNALADTDGLAVFQVNLSASSTLTTPPISHQSVSTASAAADTLVFTLAQDSDVRLIAESSPGQSVQLIDLASGEAIFSPLSSVGGTSQFHDILPAGDYEVAGNVGARASQDTQYGVVSNLGRSVSRLNYTLTVSPPN